MWLVIVLSIFGFLIFLTMVAIGGVLTEIKNTLEDIRDELKELNRR